MATFDSGRQRYSMNFYASHQRPLQRRSYTGRPSRPAEGQLRVQQRTLGGVGGARALLSIQSATSVDAWHQSIFIGITLGQSNPSTARRFVRV